eukprot:1532453-Pyramimonas_sp.AAC.3
MGILERIKEIEHEMSKTQKNKVRALWVCLHRSLLFNTITCSNTITFSPHDKHYFCGSLNPFVPHWSQYELLKDNKRSLSNPTIRSVRLYEVGIILCCRVSQVATPSVLNYLIVWDVTGHRAPSRYPEGKASEASNPTPRASKVCRRRRRWL